MIQGETFAIGYKTAKTAKVFPLESFAVYGIKFMIIIPESR